ncbi:hypothetical protein [Qipengyuania sp. NPDC077563]|uniref:hypothetical protein n=1 Tax=Qipengyuania sp. NPDC077563 TaxID=3364497 RepID=UPI00384E4A19
MINRLALVLGASILATACSSQDADTPEADDVETVDSAMPDTAAETSADGAGTQDVAEPAGETGADAASETSTAAPATGERIVDCEIVSGGEEVLNAPCQFSPQSNGGFTLMSRSGDGAIYGRILSVSVSKIDSKTAEVRGMTSDGINSRWGQATRSAQDPACWSGSDFSVCAY